METRGHSQNSPTHCLVEEEYTISIPLVRPKLELLKVLKSAGATAAVFSKKEIIGYLKNYIIARQLFDVTDPRIVHCEGDQLYNVFGVKQFTIDDVLPLLEKTCTPVQDTCLKRRRHLVSKPLTQPAGPASLTPATITVALTRVPESVQTLSGCHAAVTKVTSPAGVTMGPLTAPVIPEGNSTVKTTGKNLEVSEQRVPSALTECQDNVEHNMAGENEQLPCDSSLISSTTSNRDTQHFDLSQQPEITSGVEPSTVDLPETPKVLNSSAKFKTSCKDTPEVSNVNKRNVRKSSSSSDKVSDSSSAKCCSTSSVQSAITHSNNMDKPKSSKKTRKRKKKKEKKQSLAEPSRKRHQTEPINTASSNNNKSPTQADQPGPSLRRRGTSLSITVGEDQGPEGTSREEGFPWYIRLELDDGSEDDDAESEVLSIQDKETVRVEDSTDDLWFLEEDSVTVEMPSDTDFSVEYDVTSEKTSLLSDSDLSSIKSTEGGFLVVCKESDVEFFADYSDMESHDGDQELSEQDNWTCTECSNVNYPLQRYCGKCWKIRSDWLPKPLGEMGEIRKKSSDAVKSWRLGSGEKIDFYPADTCMKELLLEKSKLLTDSGLGTQPSSQDTVNSSFARENDRKVKNLPDVLSAPDKRKHLTALEKESQDLEPRYSLLNLNMKSGSETSLDSERKSFSRSPDVLGKDLHGVSQTSKVTGGNALDDPCMICLMRPKTASLIHGSSGHQVCCFSCAKRLRRRGKVCPVCRRPIQKVIKNYIL
ncbi:E3 ubiquitin-protein ligase Mdm2-like isoform X2 [Mya arenaria]|nr:E3 ubiquitin-protein ligase Mdm2-like isoform X2 [Mya arenaria]